MPKISVCVPHQFPPEQVIAYAVQSIEGAAKDFQARDLKVESVGNSATFSFASLAFRITGRIDARPTDVFVEVDLPLMAMAFKDTAEEAIKRRLEKAFAAHRPPS